MASTECGNKRTRKAKSDPDFEYDMNLVKKKCVLQKELQGTKLKSKKGQEAIVMTPDVVPDHRPDHRPNQSRDKSPVSLNKHRVRGGNGRFTKGNQTESSDSAVQSSQATTSVGRDLVVSNAAKTSKCLVNEGSFSPGSYRISGNALSTLKPLSVLKLHKLTDSHLKTFGEKVPVQSCKLVSSKQQIEDEVSVRSNKGLSGFPSAHTTLTTVNAHSRVTENSHELVASNVSVAPRETICTPTQTTNQPVELKQFAPKPSRVNGDPHPTEYTCKEAYLETMGLICKNKLAEERKRQNSRPHKLHRSPGGKLRQHIPKKINRDWMIGYTKPRTKSPAVMDLKKVMLAEGTKRVILPSKILNLYKEHCKGMPLVKMDKVTHKNKSKKEVVLSEAIHKSHDIKRVKKHRRALLKNVRPVTENDLYCNEILGDSSSEFSDSNGVSLKDAQTRGHKGRSRVDKRGARVKIVVPGENIKHKRVASMISRIIKAKNAKKNVSTLTADCEKRAVVSMEQRVKQEGCSNSSEAVTASSNPNISPVNSSKTSTVPVQNPDYRTLNSVTPQISYNVYTSVDGGTPSVQATGGPYRVVGFGGTLIPKSVANARTIGTPGNASVNADPAGKTTSVLGNTGTSLLSLGAGCTSEAFITGTGAVSVTGCVPKQNVTNANTNIVFGPESHLGLANVTSSSVNIASSGVNAGPGSTMMSSHYPNIKYLFIQSNQSKPVQKPTAAMEHWLARQLTIQRDYDTVARCTENASDLEQEQEAIPEIPLDSEDDELASRRKLVKKVRQMMNLGTKSSSAAGGHKYEPTEVSRSRSSIAVVPQPTANVPSSVSLLTSSIPAFNFPCVSAKEVCIVSNGKLYDPHRRAQYGIPADSTAVTMAIQKSEAIQSMTVSLLNFTKKAGDRHRGQNESSSTAPMKIKKTSAAHGSGNRPRHRIMKSRCIKPKKNRTVNVKESVPTNDLSPLSSSLCGLKASHVVPSSRHFSAEDTPAKVHRSGNKKALKIDTSGEAGLGIKYRRGLKAKSAAEDRRRSESGRFVQKSPSAKEREPGRPLTPGLGTGEGPKVGSQVLNALAHRILSNERDLSSSSSEAVSIDSAANVGGGVPTTVQHYDSSAAEQFSATPKNKSNSVKKRDDEAKNNSKTKSRESQPGRKSKKFRPSEGMKTADESCARFEIQTPCKRRNNSKVVKVYKIHIDDAASPKNAVPRDNGTFVTVSTELETDGVSTEHNSTTLEYQDYWHDESEGGPAPAESDIPGMDTSAPTPTATHWLEQGFISNIIHPGLIKQEPFDEDEPSEKSQSGSLEMAGGSKNKSQPVAMVAPCSNAHAQNIPVFKVEPTFAASNENIVEHAATDEGPMDIMPDVLPIECRFPHLCSSCHVNDHMYSRQTGHVTCHGPCIHSLKPCTHYRYSKAVQITIQLPDVQGHAETPEKRDIIYNKDFASHKMKY